jgi:hypothetical protein
MTRKKIFKLANIGFIVLLATMLGISFFFGNRFFGRPDNSAQASNVLTWGDGQVSINKVYYQSSQEKKTIQIGVGDTVTVRLKYANTSTATTFPSSYILDSLPTNFTLVNGTVKNCYNLNPCVSLNNNLFTASDLRVAPAAGFLGNATDNTVLSSNLVGGVNGYIEYQMVAGTAAKGASTGTIVSFISSGNTIKDSAEFSIGVSGIICSYLNPDPSQRSMQIGDVELRTDQDFTCNFVPRICPSVFLDLNSNGDRDGAETLENGVVDLYTKGGTTPIKSITTTNVLNGSCFETLAANASYEVKVPSPLTIYPTTGGNTVEVTTGESTALISVKFGYSSGGTLSLGMPPGVSFSGLSVKSEDQLTNTDITPIKVTDSRGGSLGWTVTCQVPRNFELTLNPSQTLPVINRLSNRPSTFQTNGGQIINKINDSNNNLGNNTTIQSITGNGSVVSMAQAGIGSGFGVTNIATNLQYNLPAHSLAGEFQTSLVCTVV